MDNGEYFKKALKTENTDNDSVVERMGKRQIRLTHAALGLVTEVGEAADRVKRHLYYGEAFDEVGWREELGDILWYICVGLDAIGETLETCMEANNRKLFNRYFFKQFSEAEAVERDEPAERKAMEEVDDGMQDEMEDDDGI